MTCFRCRDFSLPPGKKTLVMGIHNITPDSFSDGGKWNNPEAALGHALAMQNEGADIIDVGAVSTAPLSADVDEAAELSRLAPVLELLSGRLDIPVSVDTGNVNVARYALENGASVINDTSGVFREQTAELVRAFGAGWIIMHTGGKSSDDVAEYPGGVIGSVRSYFCDCLERASALGVNGAQLCFDPGIGFGKTREQDIEILKNISQLRVPGCSLLTAASRKRVTALYGGGESPSQRDMPSAVAHAAAIAQGTDIIRVHSVRDAVYAARMADAIYR